MRCLLRAHKGSVQRTLLDPCRRVGRRRLGRVVGNTTSSQSFTLLYDLIRWEEKAIVEAARKKGVTVNLVDTKDIMIDVTGEKSRLEDPVVLQRSVSHYR